MRLNLTRHKTSLMMSKRTAYLLNKDVTLKKYMDPPLKKISHFNSLETFLKYYFLPNIPSTSMEIH